MNTKVMHYIVNGMFYAGLVTNYFLMTNGYMFFAWISTGITVVFMLMAFYYTKFGFRKLGQEDQDLREIVNQESQKTSKGFLIIPPICHLIMAILVPAYLWFAIVNICCEYLRYMFIKSYANTL